MISSLVSFVAHRFLLGTPCASPTTHHYLDYRPLTTNWAVPDHPLLVTHHPLLFHYD